MEERRGGYLCGGEGERRGEESGGEEWRSGGEEGRRGGYVWGGEGERGEGREGEGLNYFLSFLTCPVCCSNSEHRKER